MELIDSPTTSRRTWWRRARRVMFWGAVLPAPMWAVVRVLGLESGLLAATPAPQLLAFTPYVAAWAVVALGLAVAARRWRISGVALAAVVALAFCVVPRAIASDVPASAAGGPSVAILTANLRLGGADPAVLMDLVRARHVDVLVLQEYTPEAAAALDRAGITGVLPFVLEHPASLAAGSALFSRYPLQGGAARRNHGGFYQVSATLAVPGGRPLVVESAHVCSPFSLAQLHCWRTDLAQEPGAGDVPDVPGGAVRILAGDFNATLDHAALRGLVDRGYRDAADAAGDGWEGTWGPFSGHPIPPVAIDHILVDRSIAVRAVGVHDLPGSDHHAVLAVLTLPPTRA